MNTLLYITQLLFSISISCDAQQNTGARLTGLGVNGVAIIDRWNENPAALHQDRGIVASISYSQYQIASDLSSQAALIVIPFTKYNIALNVHKYGFSAYHQIISSLSIAKRLSTRLSIALKGNFHQITIKNYGLTNAYAVDIGTLFQLSSEISLGIVVQNISFQQYGSNNIQNVIPRNISLGFAYRASDRLLISVNGLRDQQSTDLNLGIEYQMISILFLRTGWNLTPFKQFAGIGISYRNLIIDTAVQSSNSLGITPQISIAYAF